MTSVIIYELANFCVLPPVVENIFSQEMYLSTIYRNLHPSSGIFDVCIMLHIGLNVENLIP